MEGGAVAEGDLHLHWLHNGIFIVPTLIRKVEGKAGALLRRVHKAPYYSRPFARRLLIAVANMSGDIN